MRSILLVLLAAAALAAIANDGAIDGVGGRVGFMDGEHASIRMAKEWVRMDLNPGSYTVAATFIFTNDGPATTVKMGFPESGGGDGADGRGSTFRSFRTSVDGAPVQAVRRLARRDGDFQAFWVKTVPFAAGQTREVRVEYASDYGDSVMGNFRAAYDFTGGNWKGLVGESHLLVRVNTGGSVYVSSRAPFTAAHNQLYARWTNWQAQEGVDIDLYQMPAGGWLLNQQPGWAFRQDGATSRRPRMTPKALLPCCVFMVALREVEAAEVERLYGDAQPPAPLLTWDARAKQATLKACGHTVVFTVGKSQMLVDGAAVGLLDAPRLVGPYGTIGEQGSTLFVPLEALMTALGGTVSTDVANLRVNFTLPETGTPKPDPAIREAADKIVAALQAKDMATVATYVGPDGVRFSPTTTAYIESDRVISAADLPAALADTTSRVWGVDERTAQDIRLTFAEYHARYLADRDYAAAPAVTVGRRHAESLIASTSTSGRAYADATVVEYRHPGTPQHGHHDRAGLWLALRKDGDKVHLLGVLHDAWRGW